MAMYDDQQRYFDGLIRFLADIDGASLAAPNKAQRTAPGRKAHTLPCQISINSATRNSCGVCSRPAI
jgi:hypothetical protein